MISSSAAALLRSSCSFSNRFWISFRCCCSFSLSAFRVSISLRSVSFLLCKCASLPRMERIFSCRTAISPSSFPRRTDVSVSCARACSICRSSVSICAAIRSYSSLMPSYRVVVSLKSPSAIRYFSSVSESCARVFSLSSKNTLTSSAFNVSRCFK